MRNWQDDLREQLVARNGDFYSNDSFVGVDLTAGEYVVGVSAAGNDNYDPDRIEYDKEQLREYYRNRGYLMAQPGMRWLLPLERLRFGDRTIPDMVAAVYRDTDPRLHEAMRYAVLGGGKRESADEHRKAREEVLFLRDEMANLAWGVERLFGYSGDGINSLLGALRRAGNDPELVQARHEESAALIERAKGVLMTRMGLSEPQAFRWIQKTSMDRRLSMREVAEAIINQVA